jgi:hypothetical protein
VIAVEGLSGTTFSCNPFEDLERSGFQILCNDAVRFTHAYTPSPMAQAGLGALITGTSPLRSGLRDNGQSFLRATTETLPEKLIQKKARTFFIASAPTIKRYSRLHQGFEVFDDDFDLSPTTLYRPISESFLHFRDWLKAEAKKDTFFGIIHVSDLLFPLVVTQNELLEPRPHGFEGQLEEIDENLYILFTYLKQEHLWDRTYIILTGLNGISNPARFNELPSTNLFSENVSVPLFIKPLKGREEIPHQWKVDVHVTLQDLGATLHDFFGVTTESDHASDPFHGVSLLALLNGKSNATLSDRPIMIESSWSHWALNLNTRYSIREGQWLAIFDKRPLLYNTLTDRNEVNRVSLKDSAYQSTVDHLASIFRSEVSLNYEKPDFVWSEEFRFAQLLQDNEGRFIESILTELRTIVSNNIGSETIKWLLLNQLVRQKRWDLIESFNLFWQDDLVRQILSFKNGLSSTSIKSNSVHPCLELLSADLANSTLGSKAQCNDPDFLLLIDLITAPADKKEPFLERLAMVLRHKLLKIQLIQFDLAKGGVVMGANTKNLKDSVLFRTVLSAPRLQKDAAQIYKRATSF